MAGGRVSWILVGSLIVFALSYVNSASVAVGGNGRQASEGVANVPHNDGSNTAADSTGDSDETEDKDPRPEEPDRETTDERKRRAAVNTINVSPEARSIVGKTFDFNYLSKYTNNVQLTFAGKPVNLAAFKIDTVDAGKLDKFLRGQQLADRLYVVSKLAAIDQKIAARENKRLTTFAIDDLDDSENDIVLDPEDVDELEKEIEEDPSLLDLNGPMPDVHARVKRKVKANPSSKWPTTVHYIISSDFDSDLAATQTILDGIQHWEDETCLDFVSVDSYTGPHVVFKKLDGCWSFVGKKPDGQDISIGTNCEKKGIVAHEIGHALGFWHEQSRPDRNEYVNIHLANINPDKIHNFLPSSWEQALTLGVPYDYSSVMQYRTHSFSENGHKTITATEPDMDRTLGSRYGLSFFDVKLANYRYCEGKCSGGLTWFECKNDGYRDPKDCNKCKCPDGLTGTHCTVVKPAVNANCGSNDLTATTSWATLASPNYLTSGYPAYSECTWRIKAGGNNKRLIMQFTDTFSFHCYTTCRNYIEVRYQDLARTGPRYCCAPKPTQYFRSHGSEMLLLMRINSFGGLNGFKLKYKTESCGGCQTTTSTSALACLHTKSYQCRGLYFVANPSGKFPSPRYRSNTCYKQMRTCCAGFRLGGQTCYKEWSNWSDSSSCTRTCGNEGTKTRSRICLVSSCMYIQCPESKGLYRCRRPS